MSAKVVKRLAWVLCGVVVIASIGNVIWGLTKYNAVFGLTESVRGFMHSIVFGIMGALILSHQPRNTVGWLLMIESALVFLFPLDTYFSNLTQA
ncbi:MAG: hypothetical protein WBP47_03570, partial [Candidatus Promineifilaceae bacterium]